MTPEKQVTAMFKMYGIFSLISWFIYGICPNENHLFTNMTKNH